MLEIDSTYYVGIDLATQRDFTAITIVEPSIWLSAQTQRELHIDLMGESHWCSPTDYVPALEQEIRDRAEKEGRPAQTPLTLVSIERLPLRLQYPVIVEHIVKLVQAIYAKGRTCNLVLDAAGLGRPVADQLRAEGLPLAAITLTGGDAIKLTGLDEWSVSKARIIHSLIVAFQRGQLHLLKGLPGLDDLLSELQSFEVSLTSTARERFEARSGAHDDLMLSLGLAVFFREFWRRYWDLEHLQQQREATAATQAGVDEWLV